MTFGATVGTISEEAFLVSEFRRGKTRAFEQIFLRHYGSVCYFAQDFVKDQEVAKDLVSEVFIKVWHLRQDFETLRAVKAFLYVSTKNACLNYIRRDRLVDEYRKTAVAEMSGEELNDLVMHRIFDAEVLREMHTAIDALPGQCQRVLRLTLQGLNTDDIATMMSLSSQTVRNTRVRAIEMLRKRLAQSVIAASILTSISDIVNR